MNDEQVPLTLSPAPTQEEIKDRKREKIQEEIMAWIEEHEQAVQKRLDELWERIKKHL